MRIDPDNRTVQGLTEFLEFVGLNLLYLVTCLPVVTIGAATSALLEVTIRYSDDERGRPLPDYLPALRRNLRPGLVAFGALLLPAGLLAFAAIFWLAQQTIPTTVAGFIAIAAGVYVLAAFGYATALIARYRNPLRQMLRNALLLPMAEPLRTAGLMLIPAAMLSLAIVFPPVWILILTVGFSVGAYGAAFLLRAVFSRHS
ncbi:YesL family protein [Demequina gelatinilytica]|uniref:YesL family protein n=1 Tax=Demequina gelatinilytica TaxID=1638980 RepID=UPI00078076EC|nr:DUF624 domain-containing protein [Demequina gelatinilytica]